MRKTHMATGMDGWRITIDDQSIAACFYYVLVVMKEGVESFSNVRMVVPMEV